jgi:hypothetical protein
VSTCLCWLAGVLACWRADAHQMKPATSSSSSVFLLLPFFFLLLLFLVFLFFSTRAVTFLSGCACGRLYACVCVCVCLCVSVSLCVLGDNNNNNNPGFGGKRVPVGGVPNKRHSHSRRDTEKKTQTNMLWEQSICISVRAHHQHARVYLILWI